RPGVETGAAGRAAGAGAGVGPHPDRGRAAGATRHQGGGVAQRRHGLDRSGPVRRDHAQGGRRHRGRRRGHPRLAGEAHPPVAGPVNRVTALTVPALLAGAAETFGDRTYVVTPAERLSYRQAADRSARLARWLLREGVGKGTRVGLFFPNGTDWIVWWLAVSRIGALAVPLSTLYQPAEIAKVVRLADIAVLIAPGTVLSIDVPARFEQAWPELAGQRAGQLALTAAPYLRTIVLTEPTDRPWAARWKPDAATAAPELLSAVEAEVSPADLAVMVHTSGSTADPKGVLHTHGTLVRQTSTWPAAIW